MADEKPSVFRTKALDRLSSPDRLDETIHIVSPRDWLPLAVLGLLIAVAIGWSIIGRVPTTVSGRGVLIHPRGVLDLQTLGAGRVERLRLRTGDRVAQGDVIGTVDQFELRRRLDEDRQLLRELEAQDRAKARVQTDQSRRQQQQTGLTDVYVRSQADNLRKTLADAQALTPLLSQRLQGLRRLRDAGLLASLAPELLAAEQAALENSSRITDATAQLKQLDLQRAQSEALETTLSRENLETASARRAEMQRLQSAIAVNEVQIEKNSQIVAPHAGRILEVLVENGRVVEAGARIARLEVDDPQAAIVNVGYFAVGDGKKVRPGMRVMVTPDAIERQRYGGITGVVTAVSDLPVTTDGARAMVGNSELAQGLLGSAARIEVLMTLDADTTNPSGYRWSSSSGPPVPITAGLTGDVRVVVEERAPITYVLPFLRELTGTR